MPSEFIVNSIDFPVAAPLPMVPTIVLPAHDDWISCGVTWLFCADAGLGPIPIELRMTTQEHTNFTSFIVDLTNAENDCKSLLPHPLRFALFLKRFLSLFGILGQCEQRDLALGERHGLLKRHGFDFLHGVHPAANGSG